MSPPETPSKEGISEGLNLTPKGLLDTSKNNSNSVRDALFWLRVNGELTFIPADVFSIVEKPRERGNERALSKMALMKRRDGFDFKEYAIHEFGEYIEASKNMNLVFRSGSGKGSRVTCKAPNRFSKSYQKKVKRSLQTLWDFNFRRAVLLTLTIDPRKFAAQDSMWREVGKEFNRFETALFKKIGHRIPYLSVYEAQRNGNPHIHILFFGVSRIMDWREVRGLWGLGHIWINRAKDKRKISNPVAYMSKYITKTFTDTNDENVLTQALLWLFHRRSYGYSRNLVPSVNGESSGEYELEGIVVCSESILGVLKESPDMFDALVRGLG